MGKCNTKVIQADLGIFTNIAAYLAIIRHIQESGIFRYIRNPDILKTVVYSEHWHIQNKRHIQKPKHVQNPVKHLRWSILQKQFLKGNWDQNFTPFLCQIFVNCMVKERCRRFCGDLIRFYKVIKLQSLAFNI